MSPESQVSDVDKQPETDGAQALRWRWSAIVRIEINVEAIAVEYATYR
jgi:hypothetical protein